ncbi:MAG: sensor domain-containing diguanylate cyclase [Magnetococcales bacterium]|nr:sensor domain-containing diguanylate cyclase [Magnetococcales bacterium]NGZ29348.1 sensor domain-containing diguanylate cyclase [Magnetococcales bacterium]
MQQQLDEVRISANQLEDLVQTLAATMLNRDALRDIIDHTHNAILVVSPQGTVLHINQPACDLLKCQPHELDSRAFLQILGGNQTLFTQSLDELIYQGSIRNREVWLCNLQGQTIPVLLSASAYYPSPEEGIQGFIFSALDITEHVKLRESLSSSQKSFQAIVDKSADGLLIVDQEGRVQFANKTAENLLQRPSHEMIGLPFGYPILGDDVTEVDIIRKNGEIGVAEMRMVTTHWHTEHALLVSLRDVTENVHLREQLQQLSMEDPLTGLNNRRGFMLLAEQELKVAERTSCRISMIFIDLDGMKTINDTLGHKYGDMALLETAAVMRKVFRKSDLLARLGGDEFLVLSIHEPHEVPMDVSSHLIHRLEKEVALRNSQAGRAYSLSISMGVVAVLPGVPLEESIQQADAAMYQAKQTKKQKTQVERHD